MPLSLIQIADAFFSKLVRVSRANETGAVQCICCGHSFHWMLVDCGHFITRGHMGLRYDLDNCWPVCRVCHVKPGHQSDYEVALTAKKGEEFVASLHERGYKYFRARTDEEMEELIKETIEKLTVYGNK